jgi:hypothetical protein
MICSEAKKPQTIFVCGGGGVIYVLTALVRPSLVIGHWALAIIHLSLWCNEQWPMPNAK